ncbi:DUF4365 domain-containing protein [uncultured Granulicatella sp.]|uniref:DUF4365 domain-containing protein n=1 Tax=uncultured Granulicatella sp. TaxID=316089 RepID=UPI00261FB0CD|nr:DUF4365 domain-containing protein [uncultured Granulicatella sp.]
MLGNNKKIETMGVNYISTFINKYDLLQTYFDMNDKTPLWDGEIHVLKSPTDKKEEIVGKVPVQIKTTTQEKLVSFPLSVKDLNTYSNNGGIVLFVVKLDKNYNLLEIYYKSLPPFSIKKILKQAKEKNKKVQKISVKIHPLKEEKIYAILLDFIKNSKKQVSFVNNKPIFIDDIIDKQTITFDYFGQSPLDIFDYQEEHDLFAYVQDTNLGIEIPLENPIKVISSHEKTDLVLTIGDEYVCDNITRHFLPDGTVELHTESGIVLSVEKGKRNLSIQFTRPNKLSQALKFMEGMKDLLNKKYIKLNNLKIESKASLEELNPQRINKEFEELKQISRVMEEIGINKDIDLTLFDEQSRRNLTILEKGIKKENVELDLFESTLIRIKIANIHMIYLYNHQSEKSGVIKDIFREKFWVKRCEDDKYPNMTLFELFVPTDWLLIDNCDIQAVIDSFQLLFENQYLSTENIDPIISNIILAADLSLEDVERRRLLLDWAQQLSEWEIQHFNQDISSMIINFQIKERLSKLSERDNEEITKVLIENNQNLKYCFEAAVLLKSKIQADFYWNKMNDSLSREIADTPIYNLYLKL